MRKIRKKRYFKKIFNLHDLKTISNILIIIIIICFIFFILSIVKKKNSNFDINQIGKNNKNIEIAQEKTLNDEENLIENNEEENIIKNIENEKINIKEEKDVIDNIDKNIEKNEKENKTIKTETTINMAFTGDIMCHNTIYKDAYDSLSDTYDFSYIFENIKYYIQTADIAVGNLETTFAGKEIGYSSYPTFNTPESLAYNLKKVGFDVLTTANNHCYDKGFSGVESTIDFLDDADISHTGTYKTEEAQKKVLIKNVKGIKIAFLSFTYGTNGIKIPDDKIYSVNLNDNNTILEQMSLAKAEKPDLICVCMHWGTEYQISPNSEQKQMADFLFENGADLIIGNHPHVLQPMEKKDFINKEGETKTGFVIYSLGNFIADQNKTYTKDSAILNISITKDLNNKIKIGTVKYTPIYIYKDTKLKMKKFKLIDLKKVINAYDIGYDKSIETTLYNSFVKEYNNVTKILGEEI